MKFVESAAAHAFYGIHEEYELLDIDLADYIVVRDIEHNEIVIVKPVQLARPVANSREGIISRKEFEEVLDYLLDVMDEVNTFFRFDVLHVYVSKKDHALIRLHVNVIPYEEEEEE